MRFDVTMRALPERADTVERMAKNVSLMERSYR